MLENFLYIVWISRTLHHGLHQSSTAAPIIGKILENLLSTILSSKIDYHLVQALLLPPWESIRGILKIIQVMLHGTHLFR